MRRVVVKRVDKGFEDDVMMFLKNNGIDRVVTFSQATRLIKHRVNIPGILINGKRGKWKDE